MIAAQWPQGLLSLLQKLSTTGISWGVKAGGAYSCQTFNFHMPIVFISGSLNLLESLGSVQGLPYLGDSLGYAAPVEQSG